jgi:GGDEF domain-containing protein
MADPNKVTVYCDSYLTHDVAAELAGGAYGTVVLPYHDANDEMLRQNIQRLRAEGIVNNVLFSIGGDYKAIIVNKPVQERAGEGHRVLRHRRRRSRSGVGGGEDLRRRRRAGRVRRLHGKNRHRGAVRASAVLGRSGEGHGAADELVESAAL